MPPGDVPAAIDAIRRLHDTPDDMLLAMGRRARAHYELNFAPDVGVDRLESLLERATATRRNC